RAVTRPGAPMGGHSAPAWSPDGRFLAFSVFEGGPDDGGWLVDVASGAVSRLGGGRGTYEVAFAPDGSAVYAAGGGQAIVHRIPFDAGRGRATGPPEMMAVAGVPGVRGLSVSSDGRTLAFAGLSLSSQIWAQPLGPAGAPAGPAHALTDDTSRRNSMAVIAPDGRKVSYVSSRRGEAPNIWVMDIDGGRKLQLTSDHSADSKATWFPDARRIAFFSNRGESMGFFAVDVGTRLETPLVDLQGEGRELFDVGYPREMELSPSLSQLALAVIARPDGRRRIFVTPMSSLAPRPLTAPDVWAGYPAWSPDERWLAVEVKRGASTQAAVVEVATGALRVLTDEPGQTWVRSWSPDGSHIAVAVLRAGRWSLRAIDVASGRQAELLPQAPANVYVRYPEWSPRNDVIVFERGELRGNIWTLPVR
ncbi:MAG: hypothetical protein R2712_32140, partial [Vicinamibacterales bacterium]